VKKGGFVHERTIFAYYLIMFDELGVTSNRSDPGILLSYPDPSMTMKKNYWRFDASMRSEI